MSKIIILFNFKPYSFFIKKNKFKINDNNQLSNDEKKLFFSIRTLRNSLQFSEDKDSLLNTVIVLSDDSYLSYQIVSEVYDSIVRYSYEITNQKGKKKENSLILD